MEVPCGSRINPQTVVAYSLGILFYLIGKPLPSESMKAIFLRVKYPAASWGWPSLFFLTPRGGVFDLRGIRQISAQARLLGSLLAEIKIKS